MPSDIPNLKANQALQLHVEVATGATLPKCVEAALKIARRIDATVMFTWDKQVVVCGPEDTYQGVQRRVGRRKGNGK